MTNSVFHCRNFRPANSILIFLCVSTVLWPPVAKAASVRLCGEKLVKMVLSICDNCVHGVYLDSTSTAKRSFGNNIEMSLAAAQQYETNRQSQFVLASESAHPDADGDANAYSYTWRQGRQKRGIVDDCCLNQCSYSTLKSYCCKKT